MLVIILVSITLNSWGIDFTVNSSTESSAIRVKTINELRSAVLTSSSNNTDDVIIIETGVYNVSLDGKGPLNYYELYGRKLEIIGEGNVVLSGGKATSILYSTTNSLILKNLNFQDGKAIESGGAIKSLGQLTVSNCIFQNNSSPKSGGAIYCESGYLKVSNCKFENNSTSGSWYDGGGAIFSGAGSYILSCLFKENYALNTSDSGMSVKTDWDSSTKIENSIFISTKSYSNSAHISILRGGLTAYNNLFYGYKSYSVELYEGSANVYNSIFVHSRTNFKGDSNSRFLVYNSYINESKNSGAFSSFFIDNIYTNANLGFKDSTNFNFHLTKLSSLVNKGVKINGVTDTLDIDGKPRLVGTGIDIGPYEYYSENINSLNFINETLKIYSINSNIIIDGTSYGDVIKVYSINGSQLNCLKSAGNKLTFHLQPKNLYLLKINERTYKVML